MNDDSIYLEDANGTVYKLEPSGAYTTPKYKIYVPEPGYGLPADAAPLYRLTVSHEATA